MYLNQQLSGGSPAFAGLRAVHLMWACRGGASFQCWAGEELQRIKAGPHGDKFHLHLYDTSAGAGSGKLFVPAAGGSGAVQPLALTPSPLHHGLGQQMEPMGASRPVPPPPPRPAAGISGNDACPPSPPAASGPAGQSSASSPLSILSGRPNLLALMEQLNCSAASLVPAQLPTSHVAHMTGCRAHSVAVLACGPAPLLAQAQELALARSFHWHKETFAF